MIEHDISMYYIGQKKPQTKEIMPKAWSCTTWYDIYTCIYNHRGFIFRRIANYKVVCSVSTTLNSILFFMFSVNGSLC